MHLLQLRIFFHFLFLHLPWIEWYWEIVKYKLKLFIIDTNSPIFLPSLRAAHLIARFCFDNSLYGNSTYLRPISFYKMCIGSHTKFICHHIKFTACYPSEICMYMRYFTYHSVCILTLKWYLKTLEKLDPVDCGFNISTLKYMSPRWIVQGNFIVLP